MEVGNTFVQLIIFVILMKSTENTELCVWNIQLSLISILQKLNVWYSDLEIVHKHQANVSRYP